MQFFRKKIASLYTIFGGQNCKPFNDTQLPKRHFDDNSKNNSLFL